MSGPPRQPVALNALKGNPSRRKDRVEQSELPSGRPSTPETLGPEGLRIWSFVLQQCDAVPGMIRRIDEFALGMFCHALEDVYEIRQMMMVDGKITADLEVGQRKALREAESTAIKLGARFGWSPSDRVGKVFGSGDGPKDPLQALLERRGSVN